MGGWKGGKGAWGGNNYQSKGDGKKGKWSGKGMSNKGWANDTQDNNAGYWEASSWNEEDKQLGKPGRLQANYTFAKQALRAYADEQGSCLYGKSDEDFQSNKALREKLTHETSWIFRNPATGISTCAGTIASGAEVLDEIEMNKVVSEAMEKSGLPELHKMLASAEGEEFLRAVGVVNTKGGKHQRWHEGHGQGCVVGCVGLH